MSKLISWVSASAFPIISAVTPLLFSSLSAPLQAAEVGTFSQQDIDRHTVVAVASPYGEGLHQLLVLQQLTNRQQCWAINSDGQTIEPLLLQFDFTGICGRATDSNGYSIRMGGQDLGWRYSLQVVDRNGERLLIGKSTSRKQQPELLIGRIIGTPNGFGKFEMEPGWRITQRTFNGEKLGHYYFTHEKSLASMTQQMSVVNR